ncbi:MAG TPA: glycoside hydrolase family 16 protein, partial [Ruminococcus flavefaciens]|nr:glycoside hydrolase family 16 protein [Ruminococcus flavefaciens]
MKSKKLLSLLMTGCIVSASIPVCVYAVSRIDMDYNSDETVDVFDMISARQRSASKEELESLSSFLHGQYKAPVTAEGYTLIWSDEFDGNSLDTDKWSYELGNWKLDENGNYVTNGWGNNEQEFYTDKNASVSDGVLTIAARKENYTDAVQGNYEYTSSRLSTQHKFSTCGGRIEVRAKCDSGKSLWPAIWMLPEDSVYGGWAASGEIDIMEGWGSTPDKICGTIH